MIAGVLFLSWRIFELLITVPIVGMLGWIVDRYTRIANQLVPDYILVLFIVSCLALGWIVATIIAYAAARHNAFLIAFIDFLFIGAFIGGVVVLRGIAGADCSNFAAGITTSGSYFNLSVNKWCALQKASFALGIIDILAFAVTFFLALLVHRSHRNDDRVVVKRHHNSRHGHRRSSSRGSRSGYYDRPRGSSRGHYSRRQYYV